MGYAMSDALGLLWIIVVIYEPPQKLYLRRLKYVVIT